MQLLNHKQQAHSFILLIKNMTRDKLTMGKGSIVTVSLCNIQPSKYIRKKYPNMERGHSINNAVVLYY